MRLANHLIKMGAGKLGNRAEEEKHQGRRKRGRPQLRWELRKDGYGKIVGGGNTERGGCL